MNSNILRSGIPGRLLLPAVLSTGLAGCGLFPTSAPVSESADPGRLETATTPSTTARAPVMDWRKLHGVSDAPADIWARLRQGFRLPIGNEARVASQRRWYARHPDYLDRVARRAEPFLYLITEEAGRRGMPMEVVLLPVVESAFDAFAYSHGRAAGLWQFIPVTGRRFGLKQNWWYDGRRDVMASTRAALDYLEYLHRRFDGDWLLALAAYNAGEGTVERAIRRNRRRGKPTDFWHLRLPRETRAYVPKLLALRQLVEHPDRYGVAWLSIPDAPYLEEVATGGQIDLAMAARLADLPLDRIYKLNPAFNRWATDPGGPHRLLLPWDHAEVFRKNLARLPDSRKVEWVRHRIRPGENLGSIASKYRTTVSLLRSVNDLDSHIIRAGDHLMVPKAVRNLDRYRLTEDMRLARLKNTPRGGEKMTHTVRRGDSFWELARQYGVGVRELAKWNGMAPGDPLKVGQQLVVWVNDAQQISGKPRFSGGPTDRTRTVRYTVRRGDSLARIASKFGVSVEKLQQWNDVDSGEYLQPGQKLTMYVDVTAQSG